MDLEQKAIERIRLASDLSLKHYGRKIYPDESKRLLRIQTQDRRCTV